ncbi:MAG: aspartate kinase [Holosporaceae bacterium]|nr:aspartate kinase [Holosporaceae bacterium]
MSYIVQKFGGTSVATLERIRNVADIVARTVKLQKKNPVVVVSAMAGVTNKFIKFVNEMGIFEGDAEYDQVVSSGEFVTAGLVAIALRNVGIGARSFAAWQVPIITDANYGRAVIGSIDPNGIRKNLENGVVPVICGFQGISPEKKITTLGRGGSDLTAVAVASAIAAELCEIYSDVDGVYTTDPNFFPEARKIEEISYQEMLEMSMHGAKVLQAQSVEYARRHNMVIRVASSFVDNGGTTISHKISPKPFCALAVTHNLSFIKIVHEKEGDIDEIVKILQMHVVQVIHKKILQNGSHKFIIVVDKKQTDFIMNLLSGMSFVSSVGREMVRKSFSQINVIGTAALANVSNHLIGELKKSRIDAFIGSSSPFRIGLIVPSDKLIDAVDALHKYCGLSA